MRRLQQELPSILVCLMERGEPGYSRKCLHILRYAGKIAFKYITEQGNLLDVTITWKVETCGYRFCCHLSRLKSFS